MTDRKATHPDEDQILRSMVDTTELPSQVREHLQDCTICTAERERMEAHLARLAKLARRYAPKPERRVPVPETDPRQHPWWSRNRLDLKALGIAMAAVLIALSSILVRIVPERGTGLTGLNNEMSEDYQFMTEVSALEENPLPRVYLSISGGEDTGLSEGFMDFVAPSPTNDSSSKSNEGRNVIC